jgi:hypothetical protein
MGGDGRYVCYLVIINNMNIDIKSIVKTIMRRNRGLQDPQLIYPARDWAIGMVGALVIVCGALVFSVIQYQSYTNLSLDEEMVLTMVPYRTAQVEQALERYRALETEHRVIIEVDNLDLEQTESGDIGASMEDSSDSETTNINSATSLDHPPTPSLNLSF